MDTKESYRGYKREVGKDVLKAMGVFFGIPLLLLMIWCWHIW